MSECYECRHFYHEFDTNFSECRKEEEVEIKDDWYNGKVDCPYFEDITGD